MRHNILGIDLGGTNVRAGQVVGDKLQEINSRRINADGSVDDVLDDLFQLIDQSMNSSMEAIGIGVPSVVDVRRGIVYDVQNIPSWKEVHLKEILQKRYDIPVFINNDANCFAVGEKYFGEGQDYHSLIGLIIGTGMGAGIIIHDKLYAGPNCGAGEFGMVDYLDQNYEYYGSGQFFEHVHHTDGEKVYQNAQNGDESALQIFQDLGRHIGNAIKMILYTLDPECIVFGGSVSKAYSFFQKSMWDQIQTFAYANSLKGLDIKISNLEHGGILGAAALYYDAQSSTD
ncbi:MAG TPA: ROK family protein [Balneolales bacterium]|nr:ROK family protein [Balneolales bacterium]